MLSERRLREDVEVHSFLDPDLEVVLNARISLSDPDKWIQGHFEKDQRKCWAGRLLNAGARIGEGLDRITPRLGSTGCLELVEFNDTHTHAEVLARPFWCGREITHQIKTHRQLCLLPGGETRELVPPTSGEQPGAHGFEAKAVAEPNIGVAFLVGSYSVTAFAHEGQSKHPASRA